MGQYTARVHREGHPAGCSYVARVLEGGRKLGATDAENLRTLDKYVREVIVLADGLDDDVASDLALVWRFEDEASSMRE